MIDGVVAVVVVVVVVVFVVVVVDEEDGLGMCRSQMTEMTQLIA